MGCIQKVSKIAKNPTIKKIITKISTPNLSVQDKIFLFKKFNDIVSNTLDTQTKIIINKNSTKTCSMRTASIDPDMGHIYVDGTNKNPYIYLKDILLINILFYNYNVSNEFYQIGNIVYEENLTFSVPEMGTYNSDVIKDVKLTNDCICHILGDIDNLYKKEFLGNFDNHISKEAIEAIDNACKVCSSYLREGVYDHFVKLSDEVNELCHKSELDRKELAMLSVDAILQEVIFSSSDSQEKIEKFIQTYFDLYKPYINISTKNQMLKINGTTYNSDDDIFIDVLLKEIEKIEKKEKVLEKLNGKDALKKNESEYSILDNYFLHKLAAIDNCLDKNKLGLVNYCGWVHIYKDKEKKNIFMDKKEVFADLLENDDFIKLSEKIMTSKKFNKGDIKDLVSMLNNSFGNKFKLVIQDTDKESDNGSSDGEAIYINLNNNSNSSDLYLTILHEYRHLIQNYEIENGNRYMNDSIYKYIALNNKKDEFGNDYNYIPPQDIGYHNSFGYVSQPVEYDAERFAVEFMRKLCDRSNIIKQNFIDSLVYLQFENLKFIDPEKLSIASFKHYVKSNIWQYKVASEEYDSLMKKVREAKTFNDALDIIKTGSFIGLNVEQKIPVYEMFAEGLVKINYDKDNNIIYLNNKVYNANFLTNYGVLEELIKEKARLKIQNKELTIADRNKYIYEHIDGITPFNIDSFNCSNISDFYRIKEKYKRNKPLDKKIVIKRKVGN